MDGDGARSEPSRSHALLIGDRDNDLTCGVRIAHRSLSDPALRRLMSVPPGVLDAPAWAGQRHCRLRSRPGALHPSTGQPRRAAPSMAMTNVGRESVGLSGWEATTGPISARTSSRLPSTADREWSGCGAAPEAVALDPGRPDPAGGPRVPCLGPARSTCGVQRLNLPRGSLETIDHRGPRSRPVGQVGPPRRRSGGVAPRCTDGPVWGQESPGGGPQAWRC